MTRLLRITLLILAGLLLLAAVGLFVLYRASQHVPEFYRQALAVDPAAQVQAADKFFQQATILQNDVQRAGKWQAVFTADDVNAWLAVDLPQKHPGALPPELQEPRVAIERDGITLACRGEYGGLSSVLSLKVDVYLADPNVVALRIRKARAGAVPCPLDKVLKAISAAARRAEVPLRWGQAEGDPVALVMLDMRDNQKKAVRVDAIRLDQGKIYISGTTERRK